MPVVVLSSWTAGHPPNCPPSAQLLHSNQTTRPAQATTHWCDWPIGAVAVAEEARQALWRDVERGLALRRWRCSCRRRRISISRDGGSSRHSRVCVSLALSSCGHCISGPAVCWCGRRASRCSGHVPVEQDAQPPARLGRLVLSQQRIQVAGDAGHDGRVHCVRQCGCRPGWGTKRLTTPAPQDLHKPADNR